MARMRTSDPAMEDELLKDVPGFVDDATDDTVVDDAALNDADDTQQDDGATQQQQQNANADDVDEPKLDKDGKPIVDQQQQQVQYDKQGNVIDAKGNIIAPAGKYRRLEETTKRYKQLLDETNKQVISLRGQLAETNFLNGVPSKLGLTNEETAIGLDLVAMFKNNPEQAVTTILAEAAARGVDLAKVLGNQNGINTQAITAVLDRRLAPFEKANQEREQAAKVENEVLQRYNTFMTSYPDAEPHQEAIANLMRDGKAKNEEIAYFMLREFATRNGFNFELPLGPQITAKMQGNRNNPQQRGQQRQQQPMPNGRQIDRQAQQRSTAVASPDRSYASIVEEALAEAGIR